MPPIVPIPTTRVSDLLITQRLQTQLQSDQLDLARLQTQLSTGRRITLPSEDAPAALRAIGLQRLLNRKDQVQKNLSANELYLNTTDSALSDTSSLLTQIRGAALSAVGTTTTDTQRQAAALEVNSAVSQLLNTANQQVGGRFLFSGSLTSQLPFERVNGVIRYHGNDGNLQSYGDIGLLFQTNLTGDQVFGGTSADVQGTADLNPNVTPLTRLADLHGGLGISKGGISISDGASTSIVDLSKAETVDDVTALIEAHPPAGRTITVTLTSTGLDIQLDPGPGALAIKEVGSGTTAASLGILRTSPAGNTPVIGGDLDPRLALDTSLKDILGARARAAVIPSGANNDLIFTATKRGPAFNNATIQFVDGGLGTAGSESAAYNAATNTLTVTIESGVSTANQIIAAVDAEATFSASLDPHEPGNNGTGIVSATAIDPAAGGVTAGGSGIEFDQASGLQITNGGQTYTVDISGAKTVEDLLNILNSSAGGLHAQINAAGTGIDVQTTLGGADFSIGENGGSTATELGIRSFTTATQLTDLNHGRGVQTIGATDFTIQRRDGVQLPIDLTNAHTIGDVLNLINNDPNNQNPATRVVAQLAPVGNGIELIDDNAAGAQPLQVTRATLSQAAEDLGLIPIGATSSVPATAAVPASATVVSAAANNDLLITSLASDAAANGVQVSFVDTGLGAGNETVTYNAVAKTLVFDITSGTTTANTAMNLLNNDSVTQTLFAASLAPGDGAPNDGTGTVNLTATATLAGGAPATLTGRDVNPNEVDGVFNALLRLSTALSANDSGEIERSIGLLQNAASKLNFARADLGARQQGLDALKTRLTNENVDLKDTLSKDIDADFTQVITDLAARQAAFQAALQSAAQNFKLTLLNYL